ncbi:MAG: OsmC family protein [Luteibaculum sp.]
MEITITKAAEKKFQFFAHNAQSTFPVCASPSMEAGNDGFRPMELLLVGLGGCMSVDVVNILSKQKQNISNYKVSVSADRSDGIPALFTQIRIHFDLWGDVDASKLERAIAWGVEKYCSVHFILEKTAEIGTSYKIHHD